MFIDSNIRKWVFQTFFSHFTACPEGASSDGTAPCACDVDHQLNDAETPACERKS